MSSRVWLITGCSTGLGKELAIIATQNGDNVVGTVRNTEDLENFNQLNPGKTFGVIMDVVNDSQIKEGVQKAVEKFGQIDILVNNAGYGSLGAIEDISAPEVQKQFDVNVFGAIDLIRNVLPIMRQQKSGRILNITSIAGLQGYPGVGIYNSSKFALEGVGEALAEEVRHLGIKVTNVEPGPFRTDWAGRSATYTHTEIDDYQESAGEFTKAIEDVAGKQIGDPVKGAQAMYDLTLLENPPVHLPLGAVAYDRARNKYKSLLEEFDQFEYLGKPTDFPEGEDPRAK